MNFPEPERRTSLIPILLAAGVLIAVAVVIFYFNPHDTAAITLSHTSVVPTRTNFKSESTVVDQKPAGQDHLYILTTVRITDHLRLPITIDTMSATLVTAKDEQSITTAVNAPDLPVVFGAFPQLKPLAASPLLRETEIQPGQSAEGQVILHFPINKTIWDTRKSATLMIELYHQTPQTILIP